MPTDKTEEKLMEKIFMDKNNAEYNVCEGNTGKRMGKGFENKI